jgi:transposase
MALRHKHELENLGAVKGSVTLQQGLSFGAVWVVHQVAIKLGIAKALGSSRDGKLAMWQVIARVINQGSRLSAVRLATSHAACDVLGLGSFNEDSLYENLDWLCEEQARIENELFKEVSKTTPSSLFLYDVTSSYLEGQHNQLAAFGYNRDKKRGKKQIVIGLLCDEEGHPVAIEVFTGNTQDLKTFAPQVEKVKERFGATEITFVGDRGMIKTPQINALKASGFYYITAITKPEIEKLLNENVFQMTFFDEDLGEVLSETAVRYIFRRNPVRAKEIAQNRADKLAKLTRELDKLNEYLSHHLRAAPTIALKRLTAVADKLAISKWATITITDRHLSISIDHEAQQNAAKLDGCYVIKTDLSADQASKVLVHDRYKDLASVERAFRSSKTAHLEMRPIYLRLEKRTRAHALVVMLAYKIIQHLASCWCHIDSTVEEGIKELTQLCLVQVSTKNTHAYSNVPTPRDSVRSLLNAANIKLPKALTASGVTVSTKKKLQPQRIQK